MKTRKPMKKVLGVEWCIFGWMTALECGHRQKLYGGARTIESDKVPARVSCYYCSIGCQGRRG